MSRFKNPHPRHISSLTRCERRLAGGLESGKRQHAFRAREELALLEAHVAMEEIGELRCDDRVRLGVNKLPEPGVVCPGPLDQSALACGFELGEESFLLDAEVWLQLPGETPAQVVPRLRQRVSLRML